MSGRRDEGLEVEEPALDLLDQVLGPDVVGARLLGLLGLVAARDDRDALRLARAVRQDDRAAHHLVGVLRVDAEQHRDVDGLVELRVAHVADQLDRLRRGGRDELSTLALAARNFLPLLGIVLLRRANDRVVARISDCLPWTDSCEP